MAEEMVDKLFAYVGLRPGADGGSVAGIVPVDDDCRLAGGDPVWYEASKSLRRLIVGYVYRIKVSPDGKSVASSSARPVRSFAGDALTWRVLNDQQLQAEHARRLERKYKERNEIEEAVAPLRRAYHALPYAARRAMESMVLEALRRQTKGD